jgi:hypothetical protein
MLRNRPSSAGFFGTTSPTLGPEKKQRWPVTKETPLLAFAPFRRLLPLCGAEQEGETALLVEHIPKRKATLRNHLRF